MPNPYDLDQTDLTSGDVDIAERQVLPNRSSFRLCNRQGLGHSRSLSKRIRGAAAGKRREQIQAGPPLILVGWPI